MERAAINPVFSWSWVFIAIIFGIAICILFGLYPARKAAKLDPVEARAHHLLAPPKPLLTSYSEL